MSNKKPKIAMVAFFKGGIGHYIAELSGYLREDFDLAYISYAYGLPGDKIILDDPAIKKNLTSKPFFGIKYNHYQETIASLGQVIEFLKNQKIDILHVHIGTIARETAYYLISLITVSKNMGLKVLYTFHDVEPFEDYAGGLELLKTFYNLCDFATVGGKNEFNKLVENYGFNKNKLKIAPHGVYKIFDFHKFDRTSSRQHLGIPEDAKVLLNFGIYRPYKGFDDTIKAMPAILEKNPKAYLYISSGLRLFKNIDHLKKLVSDLHLEKHVKLNFEFVSSNEIEPIFKAADLVVLPYKQVSQSGILNISYYFKKPMIVSNLFVEAPEIVAQMGVVVKPGQEAEIAKAANLLLKDKDFYQKCVDNLSQNLRADDWQKNAQILKDLINGNK